MKIIMTGNPKYGLARAFLNLRGDVSFHSRNSGICADLSFDEVQDQFVGFAKDYNVFVNNSYIDHFVQLSLCRKVWTSWKKMGKAGLIVNIGSAVRDLLRPDNRFYATSKRALEDYTRQLYLYSVWGKSDIRVTCLNFGGISTPGTLEKWPHFEHMSEEYCAQVLNWALQIPQNVNLDLLQVSPIQPMTKKDMKKQQTHLAHSCPSDFLISDFDEIDL